MEPDTLSGTALSQPIPDVHKRMFLIPTAMEGKTGECGRWSCITTVWISPDRVISGCRSEIPGTELFSIIRV
jgi:hypothetical protein